MDADFSRRIAGKASPLTAPFHLILTRSQHSACRVPLAACLPGPRFIRFRPSHPSPIQPGFCPIAVCERRARAGIMVLHGYSSNNRSCQSWHGRFAHPDGDGAGRVWTASPAPDRPPDRQADVRVPQGLKRLQISDGRGVAQRRRGRPAQERRRGAPAPIGLGNPPAQLEASPPAATETPASTENAYPYGGNYGEIAEAQEKAAATPPTIQPRHRRTGACDPARKRSPENPTPENAAVAEVEAFIPEVPGAVPEVHGAAAEACAVPAAEESIPPGIENPVSATVNEIAGKATEPAHNG